MLYMQRLSCFDLTVTSFAVALNPGTLHAEVELPIKLAWHMDTISWPSTQSTPSTEGTSNLYVPYLSVVRFTEKSICSAVFGALALNLHWMFTSAPDKDTQ